jgi:hypothetical protein
MSEKQPDRRLDCEFYLSVAQTHGEDSEPDHEVGDLQEFFRTVWLLLTPEQIVAFANHPDTLGTLRGANADPEEEPPTVSPIDGQTLVP